MWFKLSLMSTRRSEPSMLQTWKLVSDEIWLKRTERFSKALWLLQFFSCTRRPNIFSQLWYLKLIRWAIWFFSLPTKCGYFRLKKLVRSWEGRTSRTRTSNPATARERSLLDGLYSRLSKPCEFKESDMKTKFLKNIDWGMWSILFCSIRLVVKLI